MNSVTDEKKSQAFAEKMMGHINGAALALMTGIAHRTGLFDVMAGLAPSTSQMIAEAANLNERYVREALGVFVTGGIVDYDPEKRTYALPPEHAAWLTRMATPNNLAVTAQWMSVLSSVEEDIIACFRKGGGVPYERYQRFHEVMAEESQQTVVYPLIDTLIPLVEGLKQRLEQGIEVLDVGCGSGYALTLLAAKFPKSRFTGYDLCVEAVESGIKKAKDQRLSNLRFAVKDAAEGLEAESFDLITTFDAIHDQGEPQKVLNHIFKALKRGGIYLMQEIAGSSDVHMDKSHPAGPFLYTISCMHCMSVSLAQGGEGLGAMWGKKKAEEMLRKAGFSNVEIKQLDHDFINYYYLMEK